ncbi:ribonuclease H [Senna tora]|uniref:Ribonuclease H n=1 Tax=Senna tora TaxID=362788 RepID=A0A834TN07_9FABA|nr:ribonuclease H [Senna tora]
MSKMKMNEIEGKGEENGDKGEGRVMAASMDAIDLTTNEGLEHTGLMNDVVGVKEVGLTNNEMMVHLDGELLEYVTKEGVMTNSDMKNDTCKKTNLCHETTVFQKSQNVLHEKDVLQKGNVDPKLAILGKKWKKLAREKHANPRKILKENEALKRKSRENMDEEFIYEGVMEVKKLKMSGTYRVIGDGKTTHIWNDVWIPGSNQIVNGSHAMQRDEYIWVNDLMEEGGRRWDVGKLREVFDDETCERIMCIKPNRGQGEDRWAWHGEHKRGLTVKGAYRHLIKPRWDDTTLTPDLFFHLDPSFWKLIWRLPMLSRFKVFMWRTCLVILPTVDALERRGMEVRFDFSNRFSHASVLEWLGVVAKSWSEEQWCWFTAAAYYIWEARNCIKFKNEAADLSRIGSRVDRMIDEYFLAARRPFQDVQAPVCLRWEKHEMSVYKINVDAGVCSNGVGVVGGLIRDDEGRCHGAFLETNSPVLLEAVAIRRGLEVARSIGVNKILVESDARLVIEMLKTPCNQGSLLNSICREILETGAQFQAFNYHWIPRMSNAVADFMINFAKNSPCNMVWTDSVPLFISNACRNDIYIQEPSWFSKKKRMVIESMKMVV